MDLPEEVPQIPDKIEALHQYLQSIPPRALPEDWYYEYGPNVVRHLHTFSKAECDQFTTEMFTWDSQYLFQLADPLTDSVYPYMDGQYLYGLIFLNLQDPENTYYLVENISIVTAIPVGVYRIEFYLKIEEKIQSMKPESDDPQRKNSYLEIIRSKIKEERAYNFS